MNNSSYENIKKRSAQINEANQRKRDQQRESGGVSYDFVNMMRLRLKPGEEREIAICDETPFFTFFEHQIKINGKIENVPCVAENSAPGTCAGCTYSNKEGSFKLGLTVIDYTPYERDNGETIPFTRRFVAIPSGAQDLWFEEFDTILEKYGSTRGAVFKIKRSMNDTSYNTGDRIRFQNEFEDLEQDVYTRTYDTKDGPKKENMSEILPYEALFKWTPERVAKALGQQYTPPPGSREEGRPQEQRESGEAGDFSSRHPGATTGRMRSDRPNPGGRISHGARNSEGPRSGRASPSPAADDGFDDDVPFDGGQPVQEERAQNPTPDPERRPSRAPRGGRLRRPGA